MKISCPDCSRIYLINDRYIYDLEACKSRLNLDGAPGLFQGREREIPSGDLLKNDVIKNLKKLYPMPHLTYKYKEASFL